jgi:ribosomal protein L37AE/L43A
MSLDAGSTDVTAVIDISCPECGRTDAVQKEGLGTYRCTECGAEFDQGAIEPG